jgi:hypothetical protein
MVYTEIMVKRMKRRKESIWRLLCPLVLSLLIVGGCAQVSRGLADRAEHSSDNIEPITTSTDFMPNVPAPAANLNFQYLGNLPEANYSLHTMVGDTVIFPCPAEPNFTPYSRFVVVYRFNAGENTFIRRNVCQELGIQPICSFESGSVVGNKIVFGTLYNTQVIIYNSVTDEFTLKTVPAGFYAQKTFGVNRGMGIAISNNTKLLFSSDSGAVNTGSLGARVETSVIIYNPTDDTFAAQTVPAANYVESYTRVSSKVIFTTNTDGSAAQSVVICDTTTGAITLRGGIPSARYAYVRVIGNRAIFTASGLQMCDSVVIYSFDTDTFVPTSVGNNMSFSTGVVSPDAQICIWATAYSPRGFVVYKFATNTFVWLSYPTGTPSTRGYVDGFVMGDEILFRNDTTNGRYEMAYDYKAGMLNGVSYSIFYSTIKIKFGLKILFFKLADDGNTTDTMLYNGNADTLIYPTLPFQATSNYCVLGDKVLFLPTNNVSGSVWTAATSVVIVY